jgi:flavin reductase (DIM6/NTAB) family NADH-FMN oxidoreductase RutF
MSLSISSLAAALGKIPSGLAIATSAGTKGRTAFLASWYQQVSFDPPMVTLSIKPSRPIESFIEESRLIGLNFLSEGDFSSLKKYGKGFEPGIDPWSDDPSVLLSNYSTPLLRQSHAWLLLRYVKKIDIGGDHLLFIGEVIEGQLQAGEGQKPYIHIRKDGLNY